MENSKRVWYAVQLYREDSWDNGSYNYLEAAEMAEELAIAKRHDTLIVSIENDTCTGEEIVRTVDRTFYVARVADENSDEIGDEMTVTYDKAEAIKAAEQYAAHLTEEERKTHTVSVETFYNLPTFYSWTAEKAFNLIIDTDFIGADVYEEVI